MSNTAVTVTCDICVYPLCKNKILVTCQCGFEACSSCTERYIIMSGNEPQCMSCHHLWDSEFLYKFHTKSSLRRIKESQKDRLFNVEMSLLPESQEYVKYYKEIVVIKKQILDLKLPMNEHRREMRYGDKMKKMYNKKEFYNLLYEKIGHTDRLSRINRLISGMIDRLFDDTNEHHPQKIITQIKYIKRCVDEDCKGFVCSKDYKCGICAKETCKSCLNEFKEDHKCNNDDVETARLIMKDSKPCPECGVHIHKIDGCNHMFCTNCNTPFHWLTLEIQRNGNTNPHYYHWINQEGNRGDTRRVHDDENGCRNFYRVVDLINRIGFKTLSNDKRKYVLSLLRQFDHIYVFERPSVLTNDEFANNNRSLRVKYLCNEITDTNFKVQLMKRRKYNEYSIHARQLAEMINEIRQDFITKMCSTEDSESINDTYIEILKFKDYVNTCYSNLEKIYALKSYQITNYSI